MGRVTLKIVQKYETRQDGKHNVRLRITADRISRYVATNLDVAASAFNPKAKRESLNWIRVGHPLAAHHNAILRELYDDAVKVVDALGTGATADQVKAKLDNRQVAGSAIVTAAPADSLPGFMAYTAAYITRRGDSTTTDTYTAARKAFASYLATLQLEEVSFADLTMLFLKKWRTWILSKQKNNTAWLYHARLKSMYFQAVEDVPGLPRIETVVTDPFRRVRIVKIKTNKTRLYEEEVARLASLDLPWGKPKRRARDIALVMYYAHGMRVGDALRLRLSNYVIIAGSGGEEHRLIYNMGKTNKPKNVLLPAVAVSILIPYRATCTKPTDTLFPYLRREIDAGYNEYRMLNKVKPKVVNIRENLIKLALETGIDKALSAHVFRHSFADLARRSKLDVTQIQKALGHDQISTTQGYLDELDQASVDEVRDLFGTGPGQQ